MFLAKIVSVLFYCISIVGIIITNAGFFLIFLIGVTGIMIMTIGLVIVLSNIFLFELIDYFVKKRHESILPKSRKSFLSKVTVAIFLLLFLLTLWDAYKPRKSMHLTDSDISKMDISLPKIILKNQDL